MRVSKLPEERRAELLAAARRLFDEKGVEGTRVSDIVRSVGVAQGVFYYYFASKQQLVEQVVQQLEGELTASLATLLGSEAPFARKLAAFIELYLGFIDAWLADDATDTRALRANLFEENQLLRGGRRVLIEGLLQLVDAASAAGQLRLACPRESAKALVYGLECVAFESLPSRRVVYAVAEAAMGLERDALCALAPP